MTGLRETAEQADPAQPEQGERLLSTEPLPLAWLDELDGQAQLQVAQLVVRNSRLRDLAVDASLSNGELDVRQLAARTQRGDLAARLRMRPVQEGTEISTELTATDVIVAVRKMSEAEYARLPRQTIDMNLTGSGNSMAELGASLNGFAWMRTDGGQIPSSRMSIMMGDFLSQLLGALNPAGKKLDYLTVECGGVYLEAENGKLTTAPAIVMLSNQILITASGIIDLATEKIDMVVETNPAKGVGISTSQLVNPFTKIGGTLGKPQLVLDPKGTAIEGGAAIVTGGVSLLAKGLWTRWIGSHDICGKVEEEARTIRQKRDPGNVPAQESG